MNDTLRDWRFMYLGLVEQWGRICDLAGVDGDEHPDEVFRAIKVAARAEAERELARLREALKAVEELVTRGGMYLSDSQRQRVLAVTTPALTADATPEGGEEAK